MTAPPSVVLRHVRTLLLDADDNLFASEAPAFDASAGVVNRLLEAIGCQRRFRPEELRRWATGRNFRGVASELSRGCEQPLTADDLEEWVVEERVQVTRHLARVLTPDPEVQRVLRALARRYELAVVSSSALERLAVCFTAAGLDDLLPARRRFSAEDSLPQPISKPHPAVYLQAVARLGLTAGRALAIEDSATGASSAVAAGLPVLGNIAFVRDGERARRTVELERAGAFAITSSWEEIGRLLRATG